jgi:hypothetical protein
MPESRTAQSTRMAKEQKRTSAAATVIAKAALDPVLADNEDDDEPVSEAELATVIGDDATGAKSPDSASSPLHTDNDVSVTLSGDDELDKDDDTPAMIKRFNARQCWKRLPCESTMTPTLVSMALFIVGVILATIVDLPDPPVIFVTLKSSYHTVSFVVFKFDPKPVTVGLLVFSAIWMGVLMSACANRWNNDMLNRLDHQRLWFTITTYPFTLTLIATMVGVVEIWILIAIAWTSLFACILVWKYEYENSVVANMRLRQRVSPSSGATTLAGGQVMERDAGMGEVHGLHYGIIAIALQASVYLFMWSIFITDTLQSSSPSENGMRGSMLMFATLHLAAVIATYCTQHVCGHHKYTTIGQILTGLDTTLKLVLLAYVSFVF